MEQTRVQTLKFPELVATKKNKPLPDSVDFFTLLLLPKPDLVSDQQF
jgi:hypothetical protein